MYGPCSSLSCNKWWVVKQATSLFNSFCRNVAKTVHLFVAVLPYLYDNLLVVINFFNALYRTDIMWNSTKLMTKAKELFRMIEWKQAGVIITSTSYFDAFNIPWNPIRSILHVFNFDRYSLSGISFFGFWLYTYSVFLILNIRNKVLGFSPLVLYTIVNSCALIKWSCLTS